MDEREVRILEVKESVLADNDADAERLREENREKSIYYVNIMSSPGSGKTSMLKQTISRLRDRLRIGVMEADIDSDVDARAIAEMGIPAIQLHTGGMCHLDAEMSRQGLQALGTENLDLVFLENVGNLVCPAEFDTGAMKNVVLLSVPEGDDKPLKYPLMFEKADVVLVTKTDAMEAFDFDMDAFRSGVAMRHPGIPVFPVSSETGEGFDAWTAYLEKEVADFLQAVR